MLSTSPLGQTCMSCTMLYLISPTKAVTCFLLFCASLCNASWNCPAGSRFCFQRSGDVPQTWNETFNKCNQIEGELPGADHLNDLRRLGILQNTYFWTGLCFSHGRLQWLGVTPYVETDLNFIESLLPDLTSPYLKEHQMYCFHSGTIQASITTKPVGLIMKENQNLINGICVIDSRSLRYPLTDPSRSTRIVSVKVNSLGYEIDWGPVGRIRDGFLNIFDFKSKSMKLACDVETTSQSNQGVRVRWMRNGAYVGNSSKEIIFTSEDDFIPWIGFINCEAYTRANEEEATVMRSEGFHVVMWNLVTGRLISSCVNCRLTSVLDDAKNILRQMAESQIAPGFARSMEFYIEPPVIQQSNVSFVIHIRNKRIDKFDFKMAQIVGPHFPLSSWAEERSLFLSKGLYLELISPCNLASTHSYNNLTWFGYLGQTVTSGNFIDGPVCVNSRGDIITRSCGRKESKLFNPQECFGLRPRQEEPTCFDGFKPINGRCYRMTEVTNFATALAQCWAGWPIQPQILMSDSILNWVQTSREVIHQTRSGNLHTSFWLPLRRLNQLSILHTPVWMWNTESNRWIYQPSYWNISNYENKEEKELCATYDLEVNEMVMRSCQSDLPMFCSRPILPQPISALVSNHPDNVGQYFCPPGWLTHWLVLESGTCYRRFLLKEAIDADSAQQFCIENNGHLATAPNHNARIALEQVHAVFNNRSSTHSWIGLRNRGEQPGAFYWLDDSAEQVDERDFTYSWQSYSEFSEGYGVSIGVDHKWWNWPREIKLRGVICQMAVADWRNAFRLRLYPSNDPIREGEYVLFFTYNPKPSVESTSEDQLPRLQSETLKLPGQTQNSYLIPNFWQSDFDVVCHFTNYVRRFSFPRGFRRQFRALVPLSASAGSGLLTCEAWLNRPAFRFQSNTIIHRPSRWYDFVILVVHRRSDSGLQVHQPGNTWNGDSAAEELRRRLILSVVNRDIMNNLTVTSTISFNQSETFGDAVNIIYRVSFFLSYNVQRLDLFSSIGRCQNVWRGQLNTNADMDSESILHLLLQSCLPLIFGYEGGSTLLEVRSTVACPAEEPSLNNMNREIQDTYLTTNRLAWPKTRIGNMARSIQPCMIGKYFVHRTCLGSFERGAFWGPSEIVELNQKIESSVVCQTPDSIGAKLEQLERMTRSSASSFVPPEYTNKILKELLAIWEQPQMTLSNLEMTISSLRNILTLAQNQTLGLDRLLFTSVLARVVRRGQSPLMELQFLPQVLEDFIQLLNDLPVLGARTSRINLDDEVLVIAEGSDSRNPIFGDEKSSTTNEIDFNRGSVTVSKDSSSGFLFTIVTVLPTNLLAVDPRTKTNYIDMHTLDPSDPTTTYYVGQYYAGRTTVNVNFRANTKMAGATPTEPFMLTFKEDDDLSSLSEGTFVCAKWNYRLTSSHGGWYTGSCWYLGHDVTRTHFCHCHSAGIYGLFRSDDEGTLRLAMIHRLSIIINLVFFTLLTAFLIVRSLHFQRKTPHQTALIELIACLQMVISWTAMLFALLGQYLVSGNIVGCLVLISIFQFFLTAAFFWHCTQLVIRRWQICEHWTANQSTSLKTSFGNWALSCVVIGLISIYKWTYLNVDPGVKCWLEDPVDFALTVGIVCIATVFSFTVNCKNINDQSKIVAFSKRKTNDWLSFCNTPLMGLAGVLAVMANSWLRATPGLAILFYCVSLLLGFLWMLFSLTLGSASWVLHEFSTSNCTIAKDTQLNTSVYSSSVKRLNDD